MKPQLSYVALLCLPCVLVISARQDTSGTAYIAFVNDVHNRLEEEEPATATPCQPSTQAQGRCVGGWARISTEIKALRKQAAKEGAAFWFLDAGDEFTGSMWDVVYKGSITPLVQQRVKPDIMTLGNHEFDYGVAILGAYIRNLSSVTPMLGGCNMDPSAEPEMKGLLRKWVVLTHNTPSKTYKVGVIGWISPDTADTAPSVGKVVFSSVKSSVRKCLAELTAQHKDLDYIIGLSHAGYESDLETAKNVSGLDVIIGGHSHTFLYSPSEVGPLVTRKPGVNASNCAEQFACDRAAGPYPTWVGNVPVVQAYYSSKYLGLIKVDLASRKLIPGVAPLLLGGANSSRNVQQDPEILDLLKQYAGPVEALKTQVVGKTLVPLEGSATVARRNETNLGNFICESLIKAVPASVTAKTGNINICLMVSGGIRTGIQNPGKITVADVVAMLPYANANAIFSIKGQVLLNAIKNGLSAYPLGGRFLQVAGLRYFHNNGAFLSAVVLKADGSAVPIDPAKTYTVTATDYMLQGGDGFKFTDADVLLPAGQPYAELFMANLKRYPNGIAPTTNNRIINCAVYPTFPGCPGTAKSSSG